MFRSKQQMVIKNFRESSVIMLEEYTKLAQENRELRKQIEKSYEEISNEKIDALTNSNTALRESMIYNVSPSECKTINDFRLTHNHSKSFIFEEDGDGLVSYLSCKCTKCNEELTIYF